MVSAPKPPPTPNPYATAAAQTASNLTTAIGQSVLQNADEENPEATVTYDHNYATFTVADPQYNSSGQQTGTTNRVVPIYKRTVAYKPNVQAIFDKNLAVTSRINDFALTQTNTLNNVLNTPFTLQVLDGVAPHATAPVAQSIQTTIGNPGSIQLSIASDSLFNYDSVRSAFLVRPLLQYNIDRSARVVALRNAGIVAGMTAYNNEMQIFDFKFTDIQNQGSVVAGQEQTRLVQLEELKGQFANAAQSQSFTQMVVFLQTINQAALQRFEMMRTVADFIETFRARAFQEIVSTRAVSMNELSALLHGGQVSQPQFEGFRPGKLEGTPVGQYVYQSAALDMQKYQAKVQQQSQLTSGLLGLGGSLIGGMFGAPSDRRLKRDIVKIGNDSRGFSWYVWRYVWDRVGVCRVGVMAQEVARVMPRAVVKMPNGYLAVNYVAVNGPH